MQATVHENDGWDQPPMSTTQPAARKTHRKTRTGCRICKQRKIKCDEGKPSCQNCIRHSVRCDFLPLNSYGNLQPPAGASNAQTLSGYNSPHSGSVPGGDAQSSELNLLDLELLHNFTTATAATLHTDSALKELWKINVPKIGFRYEFVMRGILSLSALHLARYQPEKRDIYLSQAMHHHDFGLRIATSVLSNANEDNASAVYIFSALTLFFTLASPRKQSDFLLVGESGIADWMMLVKGASFIYNSLHDSLLRGSLAPMFILGHRRNELRRESLANIPLQEDPLHDLAQLIQKTTSNQRSKQVYISATELLHSSFTFAYQQGIPGFEAGDVFVWVFRVDDDYLQLLHRHEQEALVIFAFFCVVLHRLESQWWAEGWGVHLISNIYNLLDEEHKLWVRWPVEQIGWIPSH